MTGESRTLSVFLILVLKKFPGWLTDHVGFDPFGGELLVGVYAKTHLIAGADQDDIQLTAIRISKDISLFRGAYRRFRGWANFRG